MAMAPPAENCVVFGANGFIGSALVRALLSAGHRVLACDLARDFNALDPHPRLECRTLDFTDEVAVREAVTGADTVFHLVGTTKPASSAANMAFDVQSNVVSSIHLFQACVEQRVGRVLFASSGGTVYGHPTALPVGEDHPPHPIVSYGLTKLMIERYADLFRRQYGLRTLSLRIGNPFGPRHHDQQQGVIPVFIRRIRQCLPVEVWGSTGVIRDYIHVDDVAQAFLAASKYRGSHTVFNIGSGVGRSLADILQALEALAGRPIELVCHPPRGFDVPEIVLDITRARQELDWQPRIDFFHGLRETWESLA